MIYEAGAWEGIFEFDGEGGYTRAETTEAPAVPYLATIPRSLVCSGQSSGESRGPNLPGARLAGISYAGGRTLKFQFNKNRPAGKVVFVASLNERRERIRIHREISGIDSTGAFRYADDLRSARLAPPAPFAGTAAVTRDPDSVSPSLLGSLRVSFPGRRSVRLTGPSVHVSLNHARQVHGEDGSISIGH